MTTQETFVERIVVDMTLMQNGGGGRGRSQRSLFLLLRMLVSVAEIVLEGIKNVLDERGELSGENSPRMGRGILSPR